MKLRPHHLMCIRNFVGKGYDSAFTARMSEIIDMLKQDPGIELTGGCDDLCSACPHNMDGICESAEKAGRYDRGVTEACGLAAGERKSWTELSGMVDEAVFSAGQFERICSDCQWFETCREIRDRARISPARS